jgi:hypothetical protein
VGDSWQEDPQKSVLPLGRYPSLIIAGRDIDLALEAPVIDLHRNDTYRFASGGEGELLLLKGFGGFAVSSDPDSAQFDFEFDLVGFNAGQFNANPEAGDALKHVDWRAPLNAEITKIREMNFRDLVGDLANLALEKPQAERTGFSAHNLQWTR